MCLLVDFQKSHKDVYYTTKSQKKKRISQTIQLPETYKPIIRDREASNKRQTNQ